MRQGMAVVSSLVAFLVTGGTGWSDDWDDKWKEAEKNRGTARGGEYEAAFGKAFAPAYAPWLNECAQKHGAAMGEDFDLLLKLGAKGEVLDVRTKPATKMAQCFSELARKKTFPAPPSPDYWWLAAVRF